MQIKILLLIAGALFLNSCVAQNEMSPVDFSKAIADSGRQVLDVRTPGEYNSGHIAKAFSANWNDQTVFTERTKYLDKSKPVYIYCLSGGRSAAAARVLRTEGYTVSELKGGLSAWKAQGLPLEGKTDKPQMKQEDYDSFITNNSSKLILVDIGAEWCPPCRKMQPYIDKLVDNNKNKLVLLKVDGGNDVELMKVLQAESVPYLLIYKNGKEVWRHAGFIEETELNKTIASFL